MQDDDESSYVVVPWAELSDEALNGLIDAFINRDGTDYGTVELSLEQKRLQAKGALKSGSVSIVYESTTETVTLLETDALRSE